MPRALADVPLLPADLSPSCLLPIHFKTATRSQNSPHPNTTACDVLSADEEDLHECLFAAARVWLVGQVQWSNRAQAP